MLEDPTSSLQEVPTIVDPFYLIIRAIFVKDIQSRCILP